MSFFPVSGNGYAPLSLDAGDPDRGSHDDENLAEKPRRTPPYRIYICVLASASLLTLLNIVLFIQLVFRGSPPSQANTCDAGLNAALKQAFVYSPIYDLLDLKSTVRKINGTLFPPKEPSIMRQLPNPDADMVWDEWDVPRVFPVTVKDLFKMHVDPSTVAKLEDNIWGLGDDAYATSLDVYHQLHCLNKLRRLAYAAYYPNDHQETLSWSAGRPMTGYESEINHCVDILAQALQCSGNVGLIAMHWAETQEFPVPDMSVNQKCIDFEALTQWRKEHTVDMDKYRRVMKKPEGVRQKPMDDVSPS
ncbi:hypothetical protein GQ53DRAFT_813054 [Thozetella sp. PMI_491]|nr:hypothetical protein GQ53DRAFT_813054 [Thozetella sp. PMI_491]